MKITGIHQEEGLVMFELTFECPKNNTTKRFTICYDIEDKTCSFKSEDLCLIDEIKEGVKVAKKVLSQMF